MMKAQWAALFVEVGGYVASSAAPMINAAPQVKLPQICSGRLPTRSIKKKKMAWASSPMIELMPWYSNVLCVEIPIWAKMAGEKYWIAETPVIWADAWHAQASMIRRVLDLFLNSSMYVFAAF